ncbi:efflux RND transporter periplasmic adaptor subunit [Aporhodopirellula aestuarii]|uniref:HlyD family efflux transporter periplasmic adaptor subunit n=1 Tax=Aporhodopirellula aestuarii TaxID=2950107 RepID=A0ABT0UDB0_9BACT|nr:HlyD family secretion protein [Aporhodopirellula aestuarii]MCM2374777.1 HlyD family efflux transporter periplasmic adaptor subunit [Aporhodopirellula aestuarii]
MTETTETDPPHQPSPPSRSIPHIVVNVVVSVAVLGACFFGYTFLGERKKPERKKPPKSPVTVVTTESLIPHHGPVQIKANGVVVPLREIRLATEVAGRVIEQSENLRAGHIVEAGEVLIRLDPIEYELEVQRLEAQAAQETSEIAAADVGIENTDQLMSLAEQQLRIATEERTRLASLIQRQAASAAEFDVAKRSELTSRAALVELQNRRRELLAGRQLIVDKQALTAVQLKRAQLDLERCVVKSPIRGLVVTSNVEEQSFVATGTTFVTIEDIAAVEVRANLTSDQMIWIWSSRAETSTAHDNDNQVPRVPATIECEFGAESYCWPAVLARIDGSGIDSATRTYPCLFRVEFPDTLHSVTATRRLARGLFVAVSIAANPNRTLYQVSENAIRPGNRVWLNVDNKLRIVPVTLVSRVNEMMVVELMNPAHTTATFETVDVIVSPISDPTEGMPVGSPGRKEPLSSAMAEEPFEVRTLTFEQAESDQDEADTAKVDG